jgi:acyl dehydratase
MTKSVLGQWLGLLPLALKGKRGSPAMNDTTSLDMPDLQATTTLVADGAWLAAYRSLVGAIDDGMLPPCAPQVLAAPLHLQILRDERFSWPVLGMVHAENTIVEYRRIVATSTLDLRVALSRQEKTSRGVRVTLTTQARVQGELAWTSELVALIRLASSRTPESSAKKATPEVSSGPSRWWSSSSVRLPEDLGRCYARVSGDANPIHWNRWTARPFGFRRAIIHGMWTKARALAEAEAHLPTGPRRIHARFHQPVFLPSCVIVSSGAGAAPGTVEVAVTPSRPGRTHLTVVVEPVRDR